jgi:hypothetical protein
MENGSKQANATVQQCSFECHDSRAFGHLAGEILAVVKQTAELRPFALHLKDLLLEHFDVPRNLSVAQNPQGHCKGGDSLRIGHNLRLHSLGFSDDL